MYMHIDIVILKVYMVFVVTEVFVIEGSFAAEAFNWVNFS